MSGPDGGQASGQAVDPAASAAPPVVELVDVRKAFNVGTPIENEVLHGIRFTLPRGAFCAVIGPSGSGKSTLLNLVGLLDRPTSGTVRIEGTDTAAMNDAELTRLRGRRIGFVFQYHHLLGAFSALENVVMPMLGDRGFADEAMQSRAAALIEAVGLSPFAARPANRLSGGQQQRVAVARALAMNPALLLADEPTGNLDTRSADAVFELLRQVNREHGTSVLFVTHNPDLASRCDGTLRVVDGMIVE